MNAIIIGIVVVVLLAVFGKGLYMKINQVLWPREIPERVLGRRVFLHKFDFLGPSPPNPPTGVIASFADDRYRIELDEPFVWKGVEEFYAIITARHAGHPVSRLSRRGLLAVSGAFGSGEAFTARINLQVPGK